MSLAFAQPDRAMEFAFGPADHAAVAALVYAEAGILLPPGKGKLVYGRLARRVRERGLDRFADYIALLDEDADERGIAIDALTTNHTSFFRENHHFEHFMAEAWPPLAERLAQGGCVRLWSSACSSGEEPFSWLMAILGKDRGAAVRLGRQDLRMLATDLSSEIVGAARRGRYALDVAKGVPAELRALWMRRDGDMAEIHPDVQALVTYRELNLLKPWPIRQQFDAIFCRNVMIYFDEPTKERLQTRLAAQLVPGGYFYIGHSERLSPSVADGFACIGRTTYRKNAK